MNAIKRYEDSGLYRENLFGSELIWEDTRFTFPNGKGKRNLKNLFIFAMVKKDAKHYLAQGKLKPQKWSSPVHFNKSIKKLTGRKIVGADMDSAYWNIAHKIGVISDKTHDRGLRIDDKAKHILLASLSSLGRDKRYNQITDGKITKDVVIIKGSDDLKNVYKKVRYSCYQLMKKTAKLLGEKEFVSYKTDCIYFFDSAKNRALVKRFLNEEQELDYKLVKEYDPNEKYPED